MSESSGKTGTDFVPQQRNTLDGVNLSAAERERRNKNTDYQNLNDPQKNFALLLVLFGFFTDGGLEKHGEDLANATGTEPSELEKLMLMFRTGDMSPEEAASNFSFDPQRLDEIRQQPKYQTGLFVPPSASAAKISTPGFQDGAALTNEQWQETLAHLVRREGYRNVVYKDSLGHPTVGVGHLIDGEPLRVGDKISDQQVMAYLQEDAADSYNAALRQAKEAGVNDAKFVQDLVSVNFQLGTGWTKKFPETWKEIKSGNYEKAVANIEGSLWNRQTAVRVDDFQSSLKRLADIRDGRTMAVALVSPTPQSNTQLAFNDGGMGNGGVVEDRSQITDSFAARAGQVGTDALASNDGELTRNPKTPGLGMGAGTSTS